MVYKRARGLDLGAEPPRIKLCQVGPPGRNFSVTLCADRYKLSSLSRAQMTFMLCITEMRAV